MTKTEFRQGLNRNHLTCDDFAVLCGRSRDTVYRFGETAPVPRYARTILRMLDERGGTYGLLEPLVDR